MRGLHVHEQLTRIYKETLLTRIQFNPPQKQVIIYMEFVSGNCKLLCKSGVLRRAFILVSDRVITPESATVINDENK